jgi:ABC-2 type transport system ATP-binding protein
MIETRGLRKVYRTKKGRQVTTVDAVRGIDLTVAEGEIFGFLGPNGAGKTTTLRMLATLLTPDGGEAVIAGADLLANPREVRRRIGYVAQSGSTWDEVSAREELALQARLYGASKPDALRAADATMDSFGLASFGDRWCKTYSGGQRRKVDIALGVIHRPRSAEPDQSVGRGQPAARRGHDNLHHHSLPGGGGPVV